MAKLTITVLKSPQYNRLHKKHPQIKQKDLRNSLGLAIPKEGKAYIRLTKDYNENRDTIHHEIEELVNSNPSHAINGVYFKKWYQYITDALPREIPSQIYQIAAGAIPVVGPALSAGLGTAYAKSEGGSNLQGLIGGVTGYGLGSLGKGLASGITNWAQPGGTGFMKDFGAGFTSGVKDYFGTSIIPGIKQTAPSYWFPSASAATGTTTATGTPTSTGTSLATGKGLTIPGATSNILYGGAQPSINYGAGINIGGGIGGGGGIPPISGITAKTATGQSLLQRIGQTIFGTGEGGGLLGGGKAGMLGTAMMVGSQLAGGMVEPPVPKYSPEEYVARAKETISKYNLQALPEYAQAEVAEMVNIPIEGPELEAKVNDAFAVTDQQLEISRKDQIQAINQRYSEAGATGDTQQAADIARVNRYIDEVKAISRAETRATVLAQAYDVKKSALTTVMTAGEFDSNLAYQLASMIGKEDELRNAIEANDYAQFQEAMSSIFGAGLQTVLESIMRQTFPEQFET